MKIDYRGSSKILKRLSWAVGWLSEQAGGDMSMDIYDTDGDGIVDNSERVNGHSVNADVPSDAVFTDTVYDDTAIRGQVQANADNIQRLVGQLYNVDSYWLIDSGGNQIVDSDGYPIYTAEHTSKIDELIAAVAELQGRRYLYWDEAEETEGGGG